jgi:branched-chain amino acid aminotransferase
MRLRTVYLNGQFLPESEAKISIFDNGFFIGEGVHEVSRTFRHRLFKLRDHLDRLYRSCKAIRIEVGISPREMEALSMQVLEENLPLIAEDDDYWFLHIVTRGSASHRWESGMQTQPTIAIFCTPLPYRGFAKFYKTGAHVVTPSTRQAPPACFDPKIKLNYRPQIYLAGAEARLMDPEAFALLLDLEGNVTEGDGWNFFLVKSGELVTPGSSSILEGISRQTVIELAGKMDIPVTERNFQLYDVIQADEAFMTATSRSILPISRINGIRLGEGLVPGPVTQRLIDSWNEMVGMDIVAQALKYGGVEG